MENENKDSIINLTDEELKEVAGGTFNKHGKARAQECSRTTDAKECFEKNYCVWKDGKCFPKGLPL